MNGTIGEIRLFGGNFAPRNWAFCDGQLLAISQNTALFSILGTTYGGDGRTSFALPDMRGRVANGEGTGPGLPTQRLGQRSGTEDNYMTTANMPSHTHTTMVEVNTGAGGESDPQTFLSAANIYAEEKTANAHLGGVSTGNTGGGGAINNMQPSLGLYYIICLTGVYPSRS